MYIVQTTQALTLFASIQDRPFTMSHCWDILKNEVKWFDLQNMGKHKEARGGAQPVEQNNGLLEDGSHSAHVDGACNSPGSRLGKRPIGRDRAKESRKRSSSSSQTSSSEFVSSMEHMHIEKINLLKSIEERKAAEKQFLMQVEAEKVAMERERLNMQKTKEKVEAEKVAIERERLHMQKNKEQLDFETNRAKEDERIMLVDLENLNPTQRTYYLARQAEILGRFGRGTGSV